MIAKIPIDRIAPFLLGDVNKIFLIKNIFENFRHLLIKLGEMVIDISVLSTKGF